MISSHDQANFAIAGQYLSWQSETVERSTGRGLKTDIGNGFSLKGPWPENHSDLIPLYTAAVAPMKHKPPAIIITSLMLLARIRGEASDMLP